MSKEENYQERIKQYRSIHSLKRLWEKTQKDHSYWQPGKLLEYIVLRAFELEGAKVTYPYEITSGDNVVEQIDGAIHYNNMHALIECKHYTTEKINVEPLSKFRHYLSKRHSTVFGIVFSNTPFTEVAEWQIQFMAPQLIILWGKLDFECCLKGSENDKRFLDCLEKKYTMAIEQCDYNYQYYVQYQDEKEWPKLF